MGYAPIAIFIYNRPEHTKQTISALQLCPEFYDSPVYIFCDGSKNESDRKNVSEAREAAVSILGEKANYIEHEYNRGLADSVISGIDYILSKYSSIIVLEDDLIVNRNFLRYMNVALKNYSDEERVMQISGYMFPINNIKKYSTAFFLPFTTSWGWATWRRAWVKFDPCMEDIGSLETNKQLIKSFNLDGCFDYYKMLLKQKKGTIDSWAIRWYWSVFNDNGLVLYPPVSLIKNIGFDGSGTHGHHSAKSSLDANFSNLSGDFELPVDICVNSEAYVYVKKFMSNVDKGIIPRLKRWFNFVVESLGKLSFR